VGFARVKSSIAGLEESSRPTSDGHALGRTDEEIQIVFDRYKAALYRIYNQELRKDPTLQGKILMRISIEPDGAVSLCKVESTELASPELVDKIVERIRRFNFGPKEDVQKVTILYPIDFLPAGEKNERPTGVRDSNLHSHLSGALCRPHLHSCRGVGQHGVDDSRSRGAHSYPSIQRQSSCSGGVEQRQLPIICGTLRPRNGDLVDDWIYGNRARISHCYPSAERYGSGRRGRK
jgi:hypothetical protein